MPKGDPRLPQRLDFWTDPESRMKVLALSFMRDGGKHSKTCRALLTRALKETLEELTPQEKVEFEFILNRVQVAEGRSSKVKL